MGIILETVFVMFPVFQVSVPWSSRSGSRLHWDLRVLKNFIWHWQLPLYMALFSANFRNFFLVALLPISSEVCVTYSSKIIGAFVCRNKMFPGCSSWLSLLNAAIFCSFIQPLGKKCNNSFDDWIKFFVGNWLLSSVQEFLTLLLPFLLFIHVLWG